MTKTQITPPEGWTNDSFHLEKDTYWGTGQSGQVMVHKHGVPAATPIMCMTGGEQEVLFTAGATCYLWSPIHGEIWKVVEPQGSVETVIADIARGGIRSLTCSKNHPQERPTAAGGPQWIYFSGTNKKGVVRVHPGSNLDKFLEFLPNRCFCIQDASSSLSKFHQSDLWLDWLKEVGPGAKAFVKLTGTEDRQIENFQFTFNLPWEGKKFVHFSSSQSALGYSFSGSTDIQSRIPRPGIDTEGKLLYCGLDVAKTSESITTNVRELFEFVGQYQLSDHLHPVIAALSVTFKRSQSQGKQNALWFNPRVDNQTTLRLQFQLDLASAFKEALESTLNGFNLDTVDVICKKVLVAAEFDSGRGAVEQGEVAFYASCSVAPGGGTPVKMGAGVEFRQGSIKITLQLPKESLLETMLAWLGQLIDSDTTAADKLPGQDRLFPNVHVRRIIIDLDVLESNQELQFIMTDFDIDIEVEAGFGKQEGPSPVFLLSYGWTRGGGTWGHFRGKLWTDVDPEENDILNPHYERWKGLTPVTTVLAKSINLKTIVPNQSLENIPDFIPTNITRASLYLSQGTLAIGATISTQEPNGDVPHPYLGQLALDAVYNWGEISGFKVTLGTMISLQQSDLSNSHGPTTFMAELDYDSEERSWQLRGFVEGLYASSLYEFFDNDSAKNAMPLIQSMAIEYLDVTYNYAASQSSRHSLSIEGGLLIAGIKLELIYNYSSGIEFSAKTEFHSSDVKIGTVVGDIFGETLALPDFLADITFTDKSSIEIRLERSKLDNNATSNTGGNRRSPVQCFKLVVEIKIGDLDVVFIRYRDGSWESRSGSKQFLRVGLRSLPQLPEIPPFGEFHHPFDEICYVWVNDPVTELKEARGLTRKEFHHLNESLTDKLVARDDFKEEKESDLLVGAGSHFMVLINDSVGGRSCLLDYNFLKGSTKREDEVMTIQERSSALTASIQADEKSENEPPAKAPLKKTIGPFSLHSIGFRYHGQVLEIMLDASVVLGPVEASLAGFSITLNVERLDKISFRSMGIDGMAVAFNEPPINIAGAIRHGHTANMDYYSGAVIVRFDDWLFKAAGFYGEVTAKDRDSFSTMFMFARLDGPLLRLSFGEISGIVAGFGYNSDVRTPAVDEVLNFPLLAERDQEEDLGEETTVEKLQRWIDPTPGGWFQVKENAYWAAAGLKINAFRMLSVDAVVFINFGTSVRLGIFGVATVDIPYETAKMKFAHVELGLATMVDFDYGTVKVEGQLLPTSFILHPDCHLTGGFALYSWFDAPHADPNQVGNFVFTMGGYHRAFTPPVGYPQPPRLAISWSYSSAISITGTAYFAITPKVCMGGGELHISFSSGPIKAWFDASTDFLMNYQPFYFTAESRVSVGVSYTIDAWIVQKTVSCEVGAGLALWGPPMAGRLHVEIWIVSFDINFGDSPSKPKPLDLLSFYGLVLERGNEALQGLDRPLNEAHTFLAQSGLLADDASGRWTVRAGIFSMRISCKMPIGKVTLAEKSVEHNTQIHAKPMQLDNEIHSHMTVCVKQGENESRNWTIKAKTQPLPTALWGKYDEKLDPSYNRHTTDTLLNPSGGTTSLMVGISLTVPPPQKSEDRLGVIPTASKAIERIDSASTFPPLEQANPYWAPDDTRGDDPWAAVQGLWAEPRFGEKGRSGFVDRWAEAFRWNEGSMRGLSGFPKRLRRNFKNLYVAAPAVAK
ncbi:uncharacterized protein TRUGW13939_11216 [Talaromyces rugulosus]|uniref:DUF6603 domain-containing protein n=1 Tax=Talaromyces rugulosus TaxID=121627 RepID=A0A7H8RHI7_TALRU|nr:uncharacterized protein TRUGW13939_11216 [Talaromyces rugulosus]QKX64043.1 hypothetical protein TRUGW13939_11216 [Talaromyces rugulosus]